MESMNNAMTNGQANGGVVAGVVGPATVGVVSGGNGIGQGKIYGSFANKK